MADGTKVGTGYVLVDGDFTPLHRRLDALRATWAKKAGALNVGLGFDRAGERSLSRVSDGLHGAAREARAAASEFDGTARASKAAGRGFADLSRATSLLRSRLVVVQRDLGGVSRAFGVTEGRVGAVSSALDTLARDRRLGSGLGRDLDLLTRRMRTQVGDVADQLGLLRRTVGDQQGFRVPGLAAGAVDLSRFRTETRALTSDLAALSRSLDANRARASLDFYKRIIPPDGGSLRRGLRSATSALRGWGSQTRRARGDALELQRAQINLDLATRRHGASSLQARDAQLRLEQVEARHAQRAGLLGRAFSGLGAKTLVINQRFLLLRNAMFMLRWPALITGAGLAVQALSGLSAALFAVTAAAGPAVGILAALPGALAAAGQGFGVLRLATMGVADALREQVRNVTDAALGVTNAASAESGLADAKLAVVEAEEGLARARVEAARAIRDQRRTVVTATRDEERAEWALRDARKALKELLAGPDELELADARDRAADATRDVADAETEYQAVVRRTAAILNDPNASLPQQIAARRELARAENEIGDARRGLTHATRDLDGIERGPTASDVARARLDVRAAEDDLTDAIDRRTTAIRELHDLEAKGVDRADQVVQAERDLARAQRGLASAQAGGAVAAARLNEEFDQLPASARGFVRTLLGLRPRFEELRTAAASGLFPGARAGLLAAARNFRPLRAVVGLTARALGGLAESAGRLLGSAGFGRDLRLVGGRNAIVLRRVGRATLLTADALRHVMVAAGPLLGWLSKVTVRWGRYFRDQAKAGRESGRLAGFLERTRAVLERLGSITANVAVAFKNIGRAAAPLGNEILAAIDRASEGWKRWTGSFAGQNELRRYFDDSRPAIFEIGRLLRDVTTAFFRLGSLPGTDRLIRTLRVEMLPALERMLAVLSRSFGPAMIRALTSVVKLFSELAGAGGVLSTFVRLVDKLASAFTFLVREVPGVKQMTFALIALGGAVGAIRILGLVTGFTRLSGSLVRVAAAYRQVAAGAALADVASRNGVLATGVARVAVNSRLSNVLGGIGAAGGMRGRLAGLAGGIAGGLRAALPGAIAGAGIGNVIASAVEGDTKQAMWKAGGAAAGGIVGGMVGGLPGALIGSGLGSVAGGLLGNLFNKPAKDAGYGFADAWVEAAALRLSAAVQSGRLSQHAFDKLFSRLAVLDRRLKIDTSGFRDAMAGQRAGARALAKSSDGLVAARQRQRRSADRVRAAEADLADVRRRYPAGARQVVEAENRVRRAKEADRRATAELRHAERLHGTQLAASKILYRAAWKETQLLVGSLREKKRATERAVALAVRDIKTNGISADRLKALREAQQANTKVTVSLARAQRRSAELVAEAAAKIGPRFVKAMTVPQDTLADFGGGLVRVTRTARETATKVPRSASSMTEATTGAFGVLASNTNTALQAFGVRPLTFRFQKVRRQERQSGGMIVPGTGSGDTFKTTLPAGSFVLNRNATAAYGFNRGGPVPVALEPRERVFLPHEVDQIGRGRLEAMNRAVPRFGRRARRQAGGIVALGRELQREGYTVGENPAFGGVAPVHVPNSYHYRGMALDVNADGMPGGEALWLDRLYARLKRLKGVVELLWRVKGHFDHLHVAMAGDGAVGPLFGPLFDLPKVALDGPAGTLRDLGQAAVDRVRGAALKYGRSQAGAEGGEPAFFGKLTGNKLTGRVSVFGPPTEPAETTASGGSSSEPGLALNINPGTDSGWNNATTDAWVRARTRFLVSIGGNRAVLPVIDKGPAGFTGRAIDVTGAGARQMGLDPSRFPTNAIGTAVQVAQRGGLIQRLQEGGNAGLSGLLRSLGRVGRRPLRRRGRAAFGRRIRRALGLIEGLGLSAGTQGEMATLSTNVDTWEEFARRAADLSYEVVDPSTGEPVLDGERRPVTFFAEVAGKTEAGWTQARLSALLELRNKLVQAVQHVQVEQQTTANLIAQAQRRIRTLADAIRGVVLRRRALRDEVLEAQTRVGHIRDRLARARRSGNQQAATRLARELDAHEDRLRTLRRRAGREDDRLAGVQAVREQARSRLMTVLGDDDSGLLGKQGRLRDLLPSLLGTGGGYDLAFKNLVDVQGRGGDLNVFAGVPQIGMFGGEIFDAQLLLRQLGVKPDPVKASADDNDSERTSILEGLVERWQREAYVANQSFAVLRGANDLPPYGGSFMTGGIVPGVAGEARTIIAHGGERVLSVAEQAAAGSGTIPISVLITDQRTIATGPDGQEVRAIVRDETRQIARAGAQAGRAGSILR